MKIIKRIPKFIWSQFLPAIVLGTLTIFLIIAGYIPFYYLWATLVMWILSLGLGVAVGYHRVFSHKTHSLPIWKENVILFFATFAGQGASIFWTALHRGYHHPYTETKNDYHSPIAYDKWTAFLGWYFMIENKSNSINLKYAIDLLRKKNHLFFNKHYLKILWGVPIIVAIFDWRMSLTGFCLVTMIGVLQDNLVNVFGHIKGFIGYRNFDTNDNSYNNFLLGYLGWGQGWHNNHHYDPKSFNFGSAISGKWWEIDPCIIFNKFLN